MGEYIRHATDWLISMLTHAGISETLAKWTGEFSMLLILILVSYLGYVITWRIMRAIVIPLIQKSKNQFDDLLIKHKFFRKLSYLVPALMLYYFIEDTITIPILITVIRKILELFFVLISILIINSILSTVNDYYEKYDFAKDHPIRGVIQVLQIIAYLLGFLFVTGLLTNRDLSSLVLSLGAVSAILLLIFKDPILGFVGGLQLIFNKMLSIGDWMSMPKFGADGIVLEINLTTVKVQNWDKTIVTIPTYNLITDSFQNWRGMEESGGRRIKRFISIDMDSIKFCDEGMLHKYGKIIVLKPYLEQTKKELDEYNNKYKIDPSSMVNGRRQTNLGVFRAYLKAYLKNRPDVRQDMTFLVRQLQPSDKGLPIEIYIFTKTIEWVRYEDIQADIFDHILAVIPEFDLRVYQSPSNMGISWLAGDLGKKL
ncbi:MAG TPA: mechanosensitive ion channel [Bacteroidetes bacterium]|nr:mechanosensitive ion channel [Bacteroidota bacterium]